MLKIKDGIAIGGKLNILKGWVTLPGTQFRYIPAVASNLCNKLLTFFYLVYGPVTGILAIQSTMVIVTAEAPTLVITIAAGLICKLHLQVLGA